MVVIDKELCTGCGNCVADCISAKLSVKDGKAVYSGECLYCGHCVAICPAGAVSIPEYDMEDVEDGQFDIIQVRDLLTVVKSRRSIRRYQDKRIEREKLENIVQVGRYTATGANRQACRFILVQDELEKLKVLIWDRVEKAVHSGVQEAAPLKMLVDMRADKGIDYLFRNAPAVLYIAAESPWDAGMASQNMELAAVSQGLGFLYNGFLLRSTELCDEAKMLLKVEGKPLEACMLLGYPDVVYQRTSPRKKADAVWL